MYDISIEYLICFTLNDESVTSEFKANLKKMFPEIGYCWIYQLITLPMNVDLTCQGVHVEC